MANDASTISSLRHRNDGEPWSDMDIADLRACIKVGCSLRRTALFLCRSGTKDEVAAKARALGLEFLNKDP